MKNISISAKLFIGLIATVGAVTLAGGLVQWECKDPVRFLSFLIIALFASRLKVKLPGTTGNMSVNLPFILIAVAELRFPEAVLIAAASAFIQGLPAKGGKLKAVHALFNVSTLTLAVAAAHLVYARTAMIPTLAAKSLLIALAGTAFLVADTLPVAGVIAMTENHNFVTVWREILTLTFSYFTLSAGVAAIAATATHYVGWQTPLLVLPVMIGAYTSYKRYFRMSAALAITNLQFATLPAGAREKAEVQNS